MLSETTSPPRPPDLQLQIQDQKLIFEIQGPSFRRKVHELPIHSGTLRPDEFVHWLIYLAHPIFYETLPAPELNLICTAEVYHHPSIGDIIKSFLKILDETNQLMLRHLEKRQIGRHFQNRLFYELEQKDFHDLYEHVRQKDAAHTKHLNFSLNASGTTSTAPKALGSEELIQVLVREEVRVFTTVNMYYLELLTSEWIHGMALMKFLGIECICVDFDIYSNVIFRRAAHHCNDFRRFSIHEHTNHWLNEKMNLKGVRYLPSSRVQSSPDDRIELRDDFGIVVASHSRVTNLFPGIDWILRVFEICREDDLFQDFQLWYFTTKYLVEEKLDLKLEEQSYALYLLYYIYLNGISLLKFEVLAGLKTQRKVQIFGDTGWADIFPNCYQNRYLDNYISMFENGQNLNLLVNANFSYLESNPVFQKALSLKVPYFCFPAMIKIPDLEGLARCEYRSVRDLNTRMESAPTMLRSEEYLKSRRLVTEWINSGFYEAANSLLDSSGSSDPSAYSVEAGLFKNMTDQHLHLARSAYERFAGEKEADLHELFAILFQKREPKKRIEELKFFNRDYVQRILWLREKSSGARPS